MTTLFHSSLKCPVCNTINRFQEVGSSNQLGSPDLDTRPAPMFRDTMNLWVQKCPGCGYVASRLSDPTKIDAEFLRSQAYLTCDGAGFQSELAQKFYQLYMIKKHDADARNAFWSALEAAWASDDVEDRAGALFARKRALEQLDRWIGKSKGPQENLEMIAVDVLRRLGEFERATERLTRVAFTEKLIVKVAEVEKRLCQEKDDARYTVDEGLKKYGLAD